MNEEPQNFTVISVLAIKANQLGYDQAKSLRLSRYNYLVTLIGTKLILMYGFGHKTSRLYQIFDSNAEILKGKVGSIPKFCHFH